MVRGGRVFEETYLPKNICHRFGVVAENFRKDTVGVQSFNGVRGKFGFREIGEVVRYDR